MLRKHLAAAGLVASLLLAAALLAPDVLRGQQPVAACGEVPAGTPPGAATAALTTTEADSPAPMTPGSGGHANWRPNPATFAAILDRTGATVEMARFTTNFNHASASQAANIALTARKLTGKVVAPGAVFSYIQATGPYTEAGGYGWGRMFVGDRIVPTIGGGVCQGASTLYNVVLLADLPVVERHQHGLLVPYLPPGRDATVTESGGLDFRFRNNTGGRLVLWGQAVDRELTLAIFGTKAPPRVTIHTEVLSRTPYRTQYLDAPNLPAGTSEVVAPGQDGAVSDTWLEIQTPSGTVRRNLGRDTYRSSPRIVRRGTGP
jgi:vancomycin resistance protein VanW